ncbi:chaperonin containing TCP1, subunit 8 (theta)-like [Phytophthora boehmeriae]|uniref:Chaperonin containing TCP1, subunit 8 (Theta)-like n=1 Tax=Phytophthora boehmeriae TaxID=109152 RepID=A0A8T1VT31_9STRA|nr:chaperonin containing TCP1, subunit 8 (theta)-like [Phytophthora boehmeriae]
MEQAAGSLAALCRRCFGPNGEETLLFRPPDAPIVTGEGHAVLSAWRRGLGKEHALEKFLLDTVDGLHQQLGDGSSEFILLVDAAVRHASDCLGGDRNGVDRAQLSRAFGELKWEIQSELLAKNRELILTTPIEMDWHALQPSRQFHQAAVNISTSALNGVLGEKAVKFVAELVLQWVFTAASEDKKVLHKATEKGDERVHLFCRVQQFLKCAPEAIIFMAAPSVYASVNWIQSN